MAMQHGGGEYFLSRIATADLLWSALPAILPRRDFHGSSEGHTHIFFVLKPGALSDLRES